MNDLAKVMRQIRGEMTFVELAKRTGVSRQTLMALEAGLSTKLSTLREIAKGCKLTDDQWGELIEAWVANELEEEDFGRLTRRLAPNLEDKRDDEKMMSTAFRRMSEGQRRVVLASFTIPPVLEMMPKLLELYNAGMGGIDVKRGVSSDYKNRPRSI